MFLPCYGQRGFLSNQQKISPNSLWTKPPLLFRFFSVIGISFYVGALGPFYLNPKISFGFSYVLAWFAACLNAVAGVYFAVISRYFPRPQKLSVPSQKVRTQKEQWLHDKLRPQIHLKDICKLVSVYFVFGFFVCFSFCIIFCYGPKRRDSRYLKKILYVSYSSSINCARIIENSRSQNVNRTAHCAC